VFKISKRKILISNCQNDEFVLEVEDKLELVKFTTLGERTKKDKPELLEGLNKLKDLIEEKDFNKYINRLIDVKKHDDQLLVITGSEMHRSVIMSKYLKLIKECFDVEKIRVITQPNHFPSV